MTQQMAKTTEAFAQLGLRWQAKAGKEQELHKVVQLVTEQIPKNFQLEHPEKFSEYLLTYLASRTGHFQIQNLETFISVLNLEKEMEQIPLEVLPYLIVQFSEDKKTNILIHPTGEDIFFQHVAQAMGTTSIFNKQPNDENSATIRETFDFISTLNSLFDNQKKECIRKKIFKHVSNVLGEEQQKTISI